MPSPALTSRRAVLFAAGCTALAVRPAGAGAPAVVPPPPRQATHPEISVAAPSVLSSLNARDEAMNFKCKGGMMDCDGDRREFAKKQYENFKKRMDEGGSGK
jgi:hypothetical protein